MNAKNVKTDTSYTTMKCNKKWEYCSYSYISDKQFNELGQEGWEAYDINNGTSYFKRELI